MKPMKQTMGERYWIQASFLSILFVAAYWIPLKAIVRTWMTNGDYSYGFIIPFIAGYLVWEKRDSLEDVPVKSSWGVLPVLVLFLLVSLYGILGSSGNVARPAIPFLVILFVAFCFGVELAKHLILPLGFLIFMIPVPDVLERTLGIYLKSVSTKLGGECIRVLHIPVHISGNVIDLGMRQLDVVDACNGMRYLFPLLAIGILYAHFYQRAAWKRWFCIFATLPIAVLTNGLRIGVTGILFDSYGTEAAEGFMHSFSAWVIFLVSFLFLYLTGRILDLFPPYGRRNGAGVLRKGRLGYSFVTRRDDTHPACFVSIALLLLVAVLSWSTKAIPAVKLRVGIADFPSAFAGWEGRGEEVERELILKSGAEEAFRGTYRNGQEEEIALFLGYRSTAFLENENFFHSPSVCLPASGWEIVRSATRSVGTVPVFGELTVAEIQMEEMGRKQLVYFWFQTKSRATPDKDINRFHLTLHAIQRDNTHDLFVMQVTPLRVGETIEDAERRMDRFASDMVGALTRFLSENQYTAS